MASIVPLPYAVAAVAVLAAALLYSFATFDPAVFPEHELALVAPKQNDRMLSGSERIGEGELVSPEDIAYDPQTGLIYTGGEDGWISKVAFKDSAAQSVVEKWVNTGGRPLGIAHGLHGEVIVADAFKCLSLTLPFTSAVFFFHRPSIDDESKADDGEKRVQILQLPDLCRNLAVKPAASSVKPHQLR
ncbi:hypothetical protein SASPL_152869 [Salvia splendens]|uniref:Strictosidine synthase n=1 Tax=Salvia splendens TaxID=180675 RepID=A0A8X8Z1P1_SALSN|nr:hypothetical protein SASPL_152869 [Salvia splendens]